MFRLMFRLLKLKLVQQELRDRWDAGDRVGLVVRPARCPRRTRVGKLSIWLRVGSCVQAARRLRSAVGAYASRSGYVVGRHLAAQLIPFISPCRTRVRESGYDHTDGPWALRLEGRNLYDLEDSNGVKIMQQILAAAAEGGGYVEYLWDDPAVAGDEETGSPKVGYAVPYTALGEEFILGSGFYPGSASTAVAGRSWGRLKVGFVPFSGRSDPP